MRYKKQCKVYFKQNFSCTSRSLTPTSQVRSIVYLVFHNFSRILLSSDRCLLKYMHNLPHENMPSVWIESGMIRMI
ncbi:hypothetical protein KY284_017331 [Solanum tuberosum]|nr:hypothetical protein KY284_017331 [Solanum tuberosum]